MYHIMYYGGLCLMAASFLYSLLYCLKNNVMGLIGDITGYNARKAIRKMKRKKHNTGNVFASLPQERAEYVSWYEDMKGLKNAEKTDVLWEKTDSISVPDAITVEEEIIVVHTDERINEEF